MTKESRNGSAVRRIRARKEKLFLRKNQMQSSDRRLDGVFERLYFHEIENRDKAMQRLQLPLVAFLALVGLLGHIAQNAQRSLASAGLWLWLCFSLAATVLVLVIVFFVLSLTSHTYSFIPVPREWQDYRDQCAKFYQHEDDAEKLIDAALQKGLADRFAECATINGRINARKSFYIFTILRLLVTGAFFSMLAYAVYFVGDLNSKAPYKVEIVTPVELKRTLHAQP